jgi:hypothetical protein
MRRCDVGRTPERRVSKMNTKTYKVSKIQRTSPRDYLM